MRSQEQAIELAKEVIQKTDKGNLDTYVVPIAKEEKIISKELKIDFNPQYWMVWFKRHLPEHQMYYVWEVDKVTEE